LLFVWEKAVNNWNKLPLAMRLRIDKVCDRFRDLLQKRENPRIEDFLAAEANLDRYQLFCKLLEEERAWLRRCGGHGMLREVLARHPDLAPEFDELFAELAAPQPKRERPMGPSP
jgi:hypothetical protein